MAQAGKNKKIFKFRLFGKNRDENLFEILKRGIGNKKIAI